VGAVAASFGYLDAPDVPRVLAQIDPDELEYFLSTVELVRGDGPGLPRWRERLFLATVRLGAPREVTDRGLATSHL
jgi:KUP system potassium uptake protein